MDVIVAVAVGTRREGSEMKLAAILLSFIGISLFCGKQYGDYRAKKAIRESLIGDDFEEGVHYEIWREGDSWARYIMPKEKWSPPIYVDGKPWGTEGTGPIQIGPGGAVFGKPHDTGMYIDMDSIVPGGTVLSNPDAGMRLNSIYFDSVKDYFGKQK
jgi:hypothetical protein